MTPVRAYGGVVIDAHGRILLREPANHFDGYVWTFAKGRGEAGESPEETAVREVQEETGWTCAIIARIPGEFRGGTTINEYFLMRPIEQQPFDPQETAGVVWVSAGEARDRLAMTRNPVGRERDLRVLNAALEVFKERRPDV